MGSTRPKKALGEKVLWDKAETALASAMNNFAGKGNWKVNPGDGAFYGPKIDIKVLDAMDRIHQCATIQLDFQLPIRFDLRYKTPGGGGGGDGKGEVIDLTNGDEKNAVTALCLALSSGCLRSSSSTTGASGRSGCRPARRS